MSNEKLFEDETKSKLELIKELKTLQSEMKLIEANLFKNGNKIELAENEKRYRTLFENAPVGIVMLDQNDRVLQINKTFETIFQYSLDEIHGHYINDFIIPDSKVEEAKTLSFNTLQKIGANKETIRKRKDGSFVPVQVLGVPIEINDTLIGIYGMYVDITERKQTEERLLKLNRIYEVTSNINTTIVHTSDQKSLFDEVCRIAVDDGKFIMAMIGLIDEESKNIINVAHNGFTGDYVKNMNINLKDKKYRDCPTNIAVETKEYCVCNNIETDVRMKLWSALALKNGYQSFCTIPLIVFEKVYGVIYLFSEQKYFFDEEEMRLLEEMAMDVSYCIENIYNEKKRKKAEEQILLAKDKAEEANRLKNSFLARMSHEFRTPLNVILGSCNIINETYYKSATVETRTIFDTIDEECLRLLTTMTEIFDISSIESGNFKIDLKPISLNMAVKLSCQNLKIMADKKKLNVVMEFPDPEIIVKGDEYCLHGVVFNLLHNAIKFSNKGTIKITVRYDNQNGFCSISDEGLGMSENYQKHLFEMFSQEDVGYSRPFEGTGLGLALTKKYIELMFGDLEIDSKKNVGTTVEFKIPLFK
ncbi:MAG: PAS domain S-box protein [Ignavibacteriales bacterium]|nr:PAS domain S-box protein [Ignavibacteriales bacterium]